MPKSKVKSKAEPTWFASGFLSHKKKQKPEKEPVGALSNGLEAEAVETDEAAPLLPKKRAEELATFKKAEAPKLPEVAPTPAPVPEPLPAPPKKEVIASALVRQKAEHIYQAIATKQTSQIIAELKNTLVFVQENSSKIIEGGKLAGVACADLDDAIDFAVKQVAPTGGSIPNIGASKKHQEEIVWHQKQIKYYVLQAISAIGTEPLKEGLRR